MNRLNAKYNFDLDLDHTNSLKLINDRIRDNAKVLEFGPANGRLTKYLHINRNCTVDIVEYNVASGEEAARYARKAFLGTKEGDIEQYVWADELVGEKYDFIIFADVLEHLYNPEEVLKHCKDFLRENGVILIAVPNISNSNIVLNLLNDEFNYTPTGLLDDTHIRFFTYKSLYEIADRLHYGVSNVEYTIGRIKETEVKVSIPEEKDYSVIYEHQFGNVYQWIFELNLKSDSKACIKDFPIKYIPYIYISVNGAYSENTVLANQKLHCDNDTYEAVFSLSGKKLENKIRLDPLDGIPCYFELLDARTDVETCEIIASNATLEKDNRLYFLTFDPMIELGFSSNNFDKLSVRYILKPISVLSLIRELADTMSTCREKENEIIAMKSTKGWRFLEMIRRIKSFLNWKKIFLQK